MTSNFVETLSTVNCLQKWQVAFPLDGKTHVSVFTTDSNRQIAVIIRKYTESEARFIIRGDLTSPEDLDFCLSVAEKTATDIGCNCLSTQESIDPEWLDTKHIFRARGFYLNDESWIFAGPFKLFAARIQRFESLLYNDCPVSDNIHVSSLSEGLPLARTLLNETQMMDDFEFDSRLRHGASKPISTVFSQIAWYQHEVIGVLLVAATVDKSLYEIPIRYVRPDFRQTWANALLISASIKHGEKAGAKQVQFEANSRSHKETVALAKKTGCKRVAVLNRFEKSLGREIHEN